MAVSFTSVILKHTSHVRRSLDTFPPKHFSFFGSLFYLAKRVKIVQFHGHSKYLHTHNCNAKNGSLLNHSLTISVLTEANLPLCI